MSVLLELQRKDHQAGRQRVQHHGQLGQLGLVRRRHRPALQVEQDAIVELAPVQRSGAVAPERTCHA
jgi:hypothetical protein